MTGALLTDFYELNMAASYKRRHMEGMATFSLFVRTLPAERGFLVAAGIEDCLAFLETFCFEQTDLAYLAGKGFSAEELDWLADMRFTGDVRAVPEGRIVFAEEPLVEVDAPIAEAQLVETFLLNEITFQTTLASKAARCRIASAGKIELVEFGFRRTQGIEAGLAAARLAIMTGFSATSNVEAARRFGLRPSGTMAHSYIEAFPSEIQAFEAFADDRPAHVTFLVDTYDTIRGVAHAIEVIRNRRLGSVAAIRIDSGDLIGLSSLSRRMLDEAGLTDVRIFVSGGLDEHDLAALVACGAPVDAAGIGTRVGVSADAPYLDSAYKLVAYEGRPVAKLSTGKSTYPGAKQVFRDITGQSRLGEADQLGLAGESPPPGTEPLLQRVMEGGKRTRAAGEPAAALREARDRFEADLAELGAGALRLVHPDPPMPKLSRSLSTLTGEVHGMLGDQV
ncbi:MAG: nicotinate phosphoribosyltransferase [Acidimicrobiales bacterium]